MKIQKNTKYSSFELLQSLIGALKLGLLSRIRRLALAARQNNRKTFL